MDDPVITRAGLKRLNEELERLKHDGRRAVAERLRHAATSEANLTQNADYIDARQALVSLEERIALLEHRRRSARVVAPRLGNGRVDVGERVRVRDLASGERLEVELVGPLESDLSAGRVSIVSPLGRALLGLRRGDVAQVRTPGGGRSFKVLAVEPPRPARAA
jgi:transcription elongation factor GreA